MVAIFTQDSENKVLVWYRSTTRASRCLWPSRMSFQRFLMALTALPCPPTAFTYSAIFVHISLFFSTRLPVFNDCVSKPQFARTSSNKRIFSLSEKLAFFQSFTTAELASVAILAGSAVNTFWRLRSGWDPSAKYSDDI